ncbi:MAG: nuclear transport factor 2 family protein [Stenomitos rutilans HA7619-LM2]|jgi:protease I|nr:nuclear transport factor 2 family protein [Stenomitos rutilans HA7619-LM2]
MHPSLEISNNDVLKPIQTFVDAVLSGNSELMREAFHSEAALKFVEAGSYAETGINDYIEFMKKQGPLPLAIENLTVDQFETGAAVKVEFVLPEVKFIDFFQLLKLDSGWKIVNKIYVKQEQVQFVQPAIT